MRSKEFRDKEVTPLLQVYLSHPFFVCPVWVVAKDAESRRPARTARIAVGINRVRPPHAVDNDTGGESRDGPKSELGIRT